VGYKVLNAAELLPQVMVVFIRLNLSLSSLMGAVYDRLCVVKICLRCAGGFLSWAYAPT
jgi:hypothetical protein